LRDGRVELLAQCAWCGAFRNDAGEWSTLADVHARPDEITASICPMCFEAQSEGRR
jgi:hypothetical protein